MLKSQLQQSQIKLNSQYNQREDLEFLAGALNQTYKGSPIEVKLQPNQQKASNLGPQILPSIWYSRENHSLAYKFKDQQNRYNVNFDQIFQKENQQILLGFIQNFKNDIANMLQIDPQQVYIYAIENDELKVIFDIIDKNTGEILDLIEGNDESLKEIIQGQQNYYVSVEAYNFFSRCILSYNDFDSNYDYSWLDQSQYQGKSEYSCLLYTSDAADDMQCVDLGGRRIIKKKKKNKQIQKNLAKNKTQETNKVQ
eukprot:TRINITY_DN13474_c0_g1_i2.p1 TRINITY_DN13474_c0_g1~~TRINITY_DN13474_c0_g1_i2.p1  ORF type:complete len:254 (+),score=34.08 TRINITY_DN13474_c0_g1_i2:425-1186(+)